jgi:hypothetical protein
VPLGLADGGAGGDALGHALDALAALCRDVDARIGEPDKRAARSGFPGATHAVYPDAKGSIFTDRDHDHSLHCAAQSAAALATDLARRAGLGAADRAETHGLAVGTLLRAAAHVVRFCSGMLDSLGPTAVLPRTLRRAAHVLEHARREGTWDDDQDEVDARETEAARRRRFSEHPLTRSRAREGSRVVRSTGAEHDPLLRF